MDLDQQLRTLPPEALEVIRYYGTLGGDPIAQAGAIMTATGLSDRTFGRAIRRLVTRGYLVMDGDQRYRLTDLGQSAVEAFAATDDGADLMPAPESSPEQAPVEKSTSLAASVTETATMPVVHNVDRRLIVALPSALTAGEATSIYVGFESAGALSWNAPVDLLVRLSILNGTPARAQEWSLQLSSDSARRTFQVTPEPFTQARLRVDVYQLSADGDDVEEAGGLYVDVAVRGEASEPARLVAYGVDVALTI